MVVIDRTVDLSGGSGFRVLIDRCRIVLSLYWGDGLANAQQAEQGGQHKDFAHRHSSVEINEKRETDIQANEVVNVEPATVVRLSETLLALFETAPTLRS